jgi:TorA maturation chaperone TorD
VTGPARVADEAVLAAARADVYRMLSRLFLEEVDGPALAALRGWPAFAEALPETGADDALLGALRAEYARLFLLNAYPYESVYVDPDMMLGGEVAAAVEAACAEAGFDPRALPRAGAADHVGAELALAGALSAGEAAGGAAAARWRVVRRRFLERHLAAFLPALAHAMARDARHRFYRALAGLAVGFVLADLADVARSGPPTAPDPAGQDGDGPALAERTLAEVARHLATPCRAGFLLSREELYRIAGRLSVALPMLERPRMVETLFEGAAGGGRLPALLDRLAEAAREAAAGYEALGREHPGAAAVVEPWRVRAAATAAGLVAMGREAAAASARVATGPGG